MFKKPLIALLAAAFVLPSAAMSADTKPIGKSASFSVAATVVAVDQATRMVTLKGEDGKTIQVQAGDAVKHLDQVNPGDTVKVTYTAALAFKVVKKGTEGVSQSTERSSGAGAVGQTVTSYFKIDAYNEKTHLLWGTTAEGITKSITVQDPKAQAALKKLIPGDTVEVTYSESIAIKLEKAGAK